VHGHHVCVAGHDTLAAELSLWQMTDLAAYRGARDGMAAGKFTAGQPGAAS
jgi:hypothetical protein